MIDLVDYKSEHIDKMAIRTAYEHDGDIKSQIDRTIKQCTTVCKTAVAGDEVLAVLGATQVHHGVAEVWAITSDSIKNHKIGFHKLVLKLLKYVETELKLHRMQMTVRCDFKEGNKWAKALGFSVESVLGQYGPDKSSHVMYARFS